MSIADGLGESTLKTVRSDDELQKRLGFALVRQRPDPILRMMSGFSPEIVGSKLTLLCADLSTRQVPVIG